MQNLARGGLIQQNVPVPLASTQSGRTFEFDGSTTYAEYGPLLDAAAGDITLVAILRANSSQYLGADGDRYLISSRTAGNVGFGWGIQSAIGGGGGGNVTAQTIVLNGIAQYIEANNTIESLVDTPVALRYVKSTGLMSWFRFGTKSSADTSTSTTPNAGGNIVVGALGDYASHINPYKHRAHIIVGMQGALSDAEIYELTNSVSSVWQLFAPLPRRIFVSSGAGASNDGTLARTNANDTSAASGSQTNTGTLARTNANDTSAAAGSQTNTGTLARTNANDSVSAAGNLGTFNGTVAYTNANDTSAASGSQTNTGTLARTNANDTPAASGTQTNTGTLARTNANDSVSASGSAGTISGTVAYTNANDRLAATGGGGQTRGGIQRLKETKVKKSSTAVRDLLTETIDPQPAEIAELAEEMREAVLEPEEAEAAAEPIVAQPVPEVEDKEKEARRVARRRSVMRLLLLDDMSIQSHAEEVMNEAEVKRQALIENVKASLRQAIARRKNANG
jgi:hypothetical protein